MQEILHYPRMEPLLVAWVGKTDLNASKGVAGIGLGPIAQAVKMGIYRRVALLNNYSKPQGRGYAKWLRQQEDCKVTLEDIYLSSPTDYEQIYVAALKSVSSMLQNHGDNTSITFHLSPGTPAMSAIWVLLAKTVFPATLIESSRETGVKTVSIPFEISAEFIPGMLRQQDAALQRLTDGLPPESADFKDIIHRSPAIKKIVAMARRVASKSVPVLIEGESGTGKELFAKAIHSSSARNKKPFITVNCGAIAPELIEAELFGHEKGAFTGATSKRQGYFEAADGGTLFLDEIGELPKNAQVKLLRVLQEQEVVRVGATSAIKIDVRIIAATNRDLLMEIQNGSFRDDLFYRLAVAILKVPPLRERSGDIGLLIKHFFHRLGKDDPVSFGAKPLTISTGAKNLLLRHHWPGNVRELINTLTRATIWASGDTILADDIRQAIIAIPKHNDDQERVLNRSLEDGVDLPEVLHDVATHYLTRALEKTAGNKSKATRLVGLPNHQTFSNWLKKYGLEK